MPPGRRFTLLDAMILVAASAVGIAWTRAVVPWIFSLLGALGLSTQVGGVEIAHVSTWASIPVLTAWTLADLVLRSRRPRPSWRRMARQPGAAASVAATLALAFLLASFAASWALAQATGSFLFFPEDFPDKLEVLPVGVLLVHRLEIVGFSVLVAWVTLAAGGLWRVESTWLDRSGRALGACWIALAFILSTLWQPHL